MASGPKIVHKQFNSPIGLYSQQNIKATLGKHIQDLGNGTVGINFNDPSTDKPANLANSAVLRMLEEEERTRRGYPKLDETQIEAILETLVRSNHRFDRCWPPPGAAGMRAARSWDGQLNHTSNIYSEFLKATKGQKKVVWPPVPETNGYHAPQNQQSPYNSAQQQQYQAPNQQYQAPSQQYQPPSQQYQPQHQQQSQQYQPQSQQHQAPSQQYQAPSQQYQAPSQQYQAPSQQYQQSQQYQVPSYQYQTPSQQYQAPSQPAYCEGRRQEATGLSRLIPVGPGVTASPVAPQRQGPVSPQAGYKQPQSNRWAPVSPASPQAYGSQPSYPSQQSQYSPQPPFSPPLSEPAYQQKPFEPPPTTIQLKSQPTIHQKPSPVFPSQPAAASFKGGVNMRGDMKWPPQSVKEAVAAENEARRQLALGPACRPRRVNKDYRPFFAKHALNQNYPGYRVPPGTQHYEDHSGRSSY